MLTRGEKALARKLQMGVDNVSGNVGAVASGRTDTSLGKGLDNPRFTAQFDLVATPRYYENDAGAWTLEDYANITPALQTGKFPMYYFGTGDYQAGYKKLVNEFPNTNSNWVLNKVGIFGKDSGFSFDGESVVEDSLERGDLVLEYVSTLPGGGITSIATQTLHCNQVAFGTLLDSVNSDKFTLNKIRYVVPLGSESQFDTEINIFRQSLFGKSNKDSVSPVSFISPMQQQPQISDIPIAQEIEKETALITLLDAGITKITWSIFVAIVDKV